MGSWDQLWLIGLLGWVSFDVAFFYHKIENTALGLVFYFFLPVVYFTGLDDEMYGSYVLAWYGVYVCGDDDDDDMMMKVGYDEDELLGVVMVHKDLNRNWSVRWWFGTYQSMLLFLFCLSSILHVDDW